MDKTPAWLPDGLLGAHISSETCEGIIKLARSTDPADTDQLMWIAMTRGLRHPRLAIEAIAAERELSHARRMQHLELTLIFATAFTMVAAIAQAIAAFIPLMR